MCIYIYTPIYTYIYVCMRVCVCARAHLPRLPESAGEFTVRQ